MSFVLLQKTLLRPDYATSQIKHTGAPRGCSRDVLWWGDVFLLLHAYLHHHLLAVHDVDTTLLDVGHAAATEVVDGLL